MSSRVIELLALFAQAVFDSRYWVTVAIEDAGSH